MQELFTGHGLGIYRQARVRTTIAAAVVLLVPFGAFYILLDLKVLRLNPGLNHPTIELLLGSVVFGIALALGFGRFVSNHILSLARKLDSALYAIEQREHERDQAQQELIKKLEAERDLVREKLQFESQLAEYEKYAALAQLALGAAHEINNPLLGILSHLELELRHARDAETAAEIEQCIEGTKRISATIRSLLNYARPGPLQLTKLSIERLLVETLAFVANQPLFRQIRFERRIAASMPPVTADANQISQVVMNLLLNAAQAINGPGEITVAANLTPDGKGIDVRISDNGCGIPSDILPNVCAPFFTTKRGKGTGLGLSISQSYIRNHGGELQIESTVGRGTTARFRLPFAQHARAPKENEIQDAVIR